MKYLKVVLFLTLALLVGGSTEAKGVSKHALPKIARVVGKVAIAAPRITAVGLKDTLGGILFTAEAGVDVVHAATTALSKAADLELKKNPFEYVDKGVSYVDTGLEKAYLFFFNAKI